MPSWEIDDVITRKRLDSHIAQLEYDLHRNDQRIAQLQESSVKKRRELDELTGRRDKLPDEVREVGQRVRGNGRPPIAAPKGSSSVPDAVLRDKIVRLGTFTIDELGAACGVKPGTIRHHPLFKAMLADGTLKEAGRFRGKTVYEYVKPEEPGAAFEVQRQAPQPPPPVSEPVQGTGVGYLNSLDKQLRIVARQALRDGWELQPRGGGHFELRRDGYRPVFVASTPQNAAEEAKQLRSRLKFAKPKRQA